VNVTQVCSASVHVFVRRGSDERSDGERLRSNHKPIALSQTNRQNGVKSPIVQLCFCASLIDFSVTIDLVYQTQQSIRQQQG